MALKFNIEKVICINLKSHNEQQLNNIADSYVLSLESLLELKNKGVIKIWVESAGDWVIAAIDEDRPEQMYICEKYCPITKKEAQKLLKIKPIKTPKSKDKKSKDKSKKVVSIVLDLDKILDKINETGLDSLSKDELNFLKNFK
jgi:hypothetical protein